MINKINSVSQNLYSNKNSQKSNISFEKKYCMIIPHGIDIVKNQSGNPQVSTFFHQATSFIEKILLNIPKKFSKEYAGAFHHGENTSEIYIFTNEEAKLYKAAMKNKKNPDYATLKNLIFDTLSEKNIKEGNMYLLKNDKQEIIDIFENKILKDLNISAKVELPKDENLAAPLWKGDRAEFVKENYWAQASSK